MTGLPFINWRSVPDMPPKKPRKVPIGPDGNTASALDPANWTDEATARSRAGGDVHVGIVLPTDPQGRFLVDLDQCRDPATGAAQPWAQAILDQFPGAWCEVSHSGTGWHIMGRCDPARVDDLRNKWTPPDAPHNAAEFYYAGRFVALGQGGTGDAEIDWTETLLALVPADDAVQHDDSPADTSGPMQDYNGPADDDALHALIEAEWHRKGGPLAVGLLCRDFFQPIETLRARVHAYQGRDETKPAPWDFDASSLDFALMNHLAYFTGCDVERMIRLHGASTMGQREKARRRPKYVREAAVKAAAGKRASGQYMHEKPASDAHDGAEPESETVTRILASVGEHPPDAPVRLAREIAALPASTRALIVSGCKEYGCKGAMQEALRAIETERRRDETSQAGLISDKNGAAIPNLENVRRILTTDPAWQGTFANNLFDRNVWIRRPVQEQRTDEHVLRVTIAMQSGMFPSIGVETCRHATTLAAADNPFHPVREWFYSQQWDGVSRAARLFTDYFPCAPGDDADYLPSVGIKFLVGAVARVMQPGCKLDTMPVLSGEQGQKKSSGFEALASVEWFGNDMPDMSEKDSKDWMLGKLIGEIAELSAMRGKDVEHIKNFLTTRHDSYRKAYGHDTQTYPRQIVFVGTTNSEEYLTDETGNRRFWPLEMRKGAVADVAAIDRDSGQIWAEALYLYNSGTTWWFDEGESATLSERQASVRSVDVDETAVDDWLERQPGKVTAQQVARAVFVNVPGNKSLSMRVARYLKAAGWQRADKAGGERYWQRGPRAKPHRPIEADGNVTPLHQMPTPENSGGTSDKK